MRNSRIAQTLILDPSVDFATLQRTLARLGWQRANGVATPPLLRGEPEHASWRWQGGKPYAIYSFNPVARLRVLDVATLPPVMRGAIYDALPVLERKQVDHLFFAEEPRDRLLGLWAAQETERIDLLNQAERLQRDADPTVAEQARSVSEKLKRIGEARVQTLTQLQMLNQAAPDLIRRLDDAAFVATLEPTVNDCEQLFDAQVAEAAWRAAQQAYRSGLVLHRIDADARIETTAAPAGLLRWSNELSDKFPGGYRDIAGWLNPSNIWLTWTIQPPGGSTVRYDGLVWLKDRWLWLPKIYRPLVPLCLSGRLGQGTMH